MSSKASADAQAYALKRQQLLERAAKIKEQRKSGMVDEQPEVSYSNSTRRDARNQNYEDDSERQPSSRGRGNSFSNMREIDGYSPQYSPKSQNNKYPMGDYSSTSSKSSSGYSNSSFGASSAVNDTQSRSRGPLVKKLPWEQNRKSAPPRQLEPIEHPSRSNSQENVFEDAGSGSKLNILKGKRSSTKIPDDSNYSGYSSSSQGSNSSRGSPVITPKPNAKPQPKHYQEEYDEPDYGQDDRTYRQNRNSTQRQSQQVRQPPPQQQRQSRYEPSDDPPPEPRRASQRPSSARMSSYDQEPDSYSSNPKQRSESKRSSTMQQRETTRETNPRESNPRENPRNSQRQPPPMAQHQDDEDDIPISTTKKSNPPPAFASAGNQDLVECGTCGRKFASDRIDKHETACQKTHNKARKVFDMTKARTEGTEQEKFVKKAKIVEKKSGAARNGVESTGQIPANKIPKWKRDRMNFINAIRAARGQEPEKMEVMVGSDGQEIEMEIDDGLVPCPHCGRRFNETAFARHVKICQSVFKKGGKPPPQKTAASPSMNRTQGPPSSQAPSQMSKTSGFPGNQPAPNMSRTMGAPNSNNATIGSSPRAAPASNASPSNAKSRIGSTAAKAEESMVSCPHCSRRFDKYSADRHIGICQKIFTKPKAQGGSSVPTKTVSKPLRR